MKNTELGTAGTANSVKILWANPDEAFLTLMLLINELLIFERPAFHVAQRHPYTYPKQPIFYRVIHILLRKPPAFPQATAASAPLRLAAERAGNNDFSPLWAGQNVTGCKEIPAADLTRELASRIGDL